MAKLFSALIAAALLAGVPCPILAQDAPQSGGAVVLTVADAIGPATAEYIHKGLAEAAERHAQVIVLRLDTPGGLSTSMRTIIHDILASPIAVIAYVGPAGARAASAGTYIVYASHLAAMAPSTHLGAATPVQVGGGLFGGGGKQGSEKKEKDEKKTLAPANPEEAKMVNDAVAYIRSLAQLRGRNVEWAEKAVREAATLTASEALQQHVVDFIADNVPDLLQKADGRKVKIDNREVTLKTRGLTVIPLAPDWRTRLLAIITDPNIAYLLLLAGIYGLVFEFLSPGGYFPGVLGGISLLVGLYALNLLPINYAGVGLLLLGIGMMVSEVFVPSGALGIGGAVAFILGSLLLFNAEVPGFQLSGWIIAGAAIVSVGFFVIVLAAVWRAHRRQVVIGDGVLVGSAGQVVNWADNEGEVQVRGERWRAQSTTPLAPGQQVRVVDRRNLTLIIEPDAAASPKP